MKQRVERQIGDQVLAIETGFLAKQAAGSVLVSYGETVVLVAAATGAPRPGIDFFPLTCDYRERVAAAGKFPGGFLKREGRPTLKETLTSRLMDRPIRPLFPEGFYDEVQVQANVLASDRQNDPDVLAMIGASAALCISPLPFRGPLGSVRLAQIDGRFVPFPTLDQLEESDLDLVVSGSPTAILMIEGFAREMPEDRMLQALEEAHRIIRVLCEMQEELVRLARRNPRTVLFITHGVEEAVYLADRVAVMTQRPGRIKEIVDIKAVREAERWEEHARIEDVMDLESFVHLRTHIWKSLREEKGGIGA